MSSNGCPGIVFSALRGNAGKTFITLGFVAQLRKEGKLVSPFKKGPDYIDSAWLEFAAGRNCYNLDLFMMKNNDVLSSYLERSTGSDIAIIEGNRGLYDGYDLTGSCSTAEIAKLLGLPVILIVDCTKSTLTIAATVLGCQHFDPDTPIKGVILNRIAGERHREIITRSIETTCGIPVLGAIPKISGMGFPERHMGLVPPMEHPGSGDAVDRAADTIKKYLDIESILKIANYARSSDIFQPVLTEKSECNSIITEKPRIGYIKDSAFWFYYPDNLEALRNMGAELVECNSITQEQIPVIDALYIGGGFPETHAEALSKNKGFKNSLRAAIENGLPVYAECGGLIYLGENLIIDGKSYPMTGALPVSFDLGKRPQGHGYTILNVEQPNPYFKTGSVLYGHEFHYSRILEPEKIQLEMALKNEKGHGINGSRDGIFYKNVFATYSHVHALGTCEWVSGLFKQAVYYSRNLTRINTNLLFQNRQTPVEVNLFR